MESVHDSKTNFNMMQATERIMGTQNDSILSILNVEKSTNNEVHPESSDRTRDFDTFPSLKSKPEEKKVKLDHEQARIKNSVSAMSLNASRLDTSANTNNNNTLMLPGRTKNNKSALDIKVDLDSSLKSLTIPKV